MSLGEEYRTYLGAFGRGQVTVEELRDWLADRVQVAGDSDDPDVQRLDATAWIVLAEYDYGHRDAVQFRQAIAESLREGVRLIKSAYDDTYIVEQVGGVGTGTSSVFTAARRLAVPQVSVRIQHEVASV